MDEKKGVQFWLLPDDKRALKAAAATAGVSMCDYLEALVIEAVRKESKSAHYTGDPF